MSNIKVYVTNNTSYLGKRIDDVTIVGMKFNGKLTQDVFADYFKARQLDCLVSIEIGSNQLDTHNLTRREKLDLKIVRAEFKEAKAMSEDYLIVKAFDELRGK